MPIGQPLIVIIAALFGGLVTLFTAPLWMRVAKQFGRLIKHQITEAAQVLEDKNNKKESE